MHIQLPLFLLPLTVGWILQIIKIIIDYFQGEKFGLDRFFAAGWFPSVHSGLSTSLLTSIWYFYWISWPYFAIALIFSILFWYDAANVRYQAWKHAQIINKMRNQLSDILNPSVCSTLGEKLKERLWHTFQEVVGGIVLSAIITLWIIYLGNFYWISFK
jgi:acid phosphatase family membrane protein YuiD